MTAALVAIVGVLIGALALLEQRRGNDLNAAAIDRQTAEIAKGNRITAGQSGEDAMAAPLRSVPSLPYKPSRWPAVVIVILVCVNLGIAAFDYYQRHHYPSQEPISNTSDVQQNKQDLSVDVDAKLPYEVSAKPSWNTNVLLESRYDGNFVLSFTEPAPDGATVDWQVIPLLDGPYRLASQITKRDSEFRDLQSTNAKLTADLKQIRNENNNLTDLAPQLVQSKQALVNFQKKVNGAIADIEAQHFPDKFLALCPTIQKTTTELDEKRAALQDAMKNNSPTTGVLTNEVHFAAQRWGEAQQASQRLAGSLRMSLESIRTP